ncbi:hypothetical protein D3C79_655650 [compost metagenome]
MLVIQHPEGEFQVIGHRRPIPGLARHRHPCHAPQLALHLVQQRPLLGVDAGEQRIGIVGGRHEVLAHRLWHRLDQRHQQLVAQAGDQPLEAFHLHLVEQRQRDVQGDAVGRLPGLELVAQLELEPPLLPEVRVVEIADVGRIPLHQHLPLEVEQFGILLLRLLPPLVEVTAGDHLLGQAGVVEAEQVLVIHQDVATARLVLQRLHLGQQLAVLAEEAMAGLEVPLHQGAADEQLAAQDGIQGAEVDEPLVDQGQAIEGHLLLGHDGAVLLRPVRVAVMQLDEVTGQRLHPLGLDATVDAGIEAGGLHQLGGHHPLGRLLEQAGGREEVEATVAGPQKLRFLQILVADVAEQAGQQGAVHRLEVRRLRVALEAQLFHRLAQLEVDVLPLAHPQVGEKLLLAQAAERVAAQQVLLLFQVVPQVDEGEEVGLLILEAAVLLVGGLLLLHGPLAGILDAQACGDHHHLAQAAGLRRRDHHLGEPGIKRDARQLAATLGQLQLGLLLPAGG